MSFSGGSGTEEDPYQISTCEDLNNIGTDALEGEYFVLVNDIDCQDYDWENMDDIPDNVSVDGQGYVIKNLDVENDVGRSQLQGVFGGPGDNFELKNIDFDNISVEANRNSSIIAFGDDFHHYENITLKNSELIIIPNTDGEGGSSFGGAIRTGGNNETVKKLYIENIDIKARDDVSDTSEIEQVGVAFYRGDMDLMEEIVVKNSSLDIGDGSQIGVFGVPFFQTEDDVCRDLRAHNVELKARGSSFTNRGGLIGHGERVDGVIENVLITDSKFDWPDFDGDDELVSDTTEDERDNINNIYYDENNVLSHDDTEITTLVGQGKETQDIQGDSAETNMPEFDWENIWATQDEDYPTLQFTLEPAFFEVLIDSTNSPITQGSVLEVDFTVNNTGDAGDEQDIDLEFESEGNIVNTVVDLSVAGGGTESGQLTYSVPSDQDPDEYDIWVKSEDDSATDTVTVEVATGTVSGSVTVLGDPLEDAEIYIVDSGSDEVIEKVTTNENGEFTSSDIETGKTVHVTAQNPANESHSDESKPFIEIEET